MCYTLHEKYDNKEAIVMSKIKAVLLSLLKLAAIVFAATILGKLFTEPYHTLAVNDPEYLVTIC